jgi:hypothetical protein
MLRITIHDTPETVTLQFEGRLAGPWVGEAGECWRRVRAGQYKSVYRFDLTSVTLVDSAGKAFLSSAHAVGAELIACGCLMRAIVAELTHTPVPDCG